MARDMKANSKIISKMVIILKKEKEKFILLMVRQWKESGSKEFCKKKLKINTKKIIIKNKFIKIKFIKV